MAWNNARPVAAHWELKSFSSSPQIVFLDSFGGIVIRTIRKTMFRQIPALKPA
jgi:hypothetical protein